MTLYPKARGLNIEGSEPGLAMSSKLYVKDKMRETANPVSTVYVVVRRGTLKKNVREKTNSNIGMIIR